MKLAAAAAVLMIAAVAVGQTVYTTSDGAMAASMCLNTVTNVWATCTPMPKPKPHKRKPPVKPNFLIQCEGVCGKGPQVSSKDVLPCDGISCVGPVEMMPQKKDYEIGAGSGKFMFPWQLDPPNPFRTQTSQWANGAVVTQTATAIVALLPQDEYSHLQQLRAAVVEEEKRLAVEYGAQLKEACPECPMVSIWPPPKPYHPDHYEYHGQFLLIDRH